MRSAVCLIVSLFLFATAGAAHAADWTYDPSRGPAGEASVRGTAGTRLVVGCNAEGDPAYILRGTRMPNGQFKAGFNIDKQNLPGMLICTGGTCAFTANDRRIGRLSVRMQAGLTANFHAGGARIDKYSLIGSAAAMAQVARRGCDI